MAFWPNGLVSGFAGEQMNEWRRGILLCLSVNKSRLADSLRRHAKLQGVDIREINERDITKPQYVWNLLRGDAANCVAFGCKNLSLQRFQFFLKFYLLLSWKPDRYLVDEENTVIKVTWASYALSDFPRFVLESVVSLWILLSASIILPFLRSSFRRKKT